METISIERGPHPVEGDFHRAAKRTCDGSRAGPRRGPPSLRRVIESLVKAAARQYLIPLLSFSFSFLSPSFSSRPFFFHRSLCSLSATIPSTNSRQATPSPLVLFIFYHYHIRFFSILLCAPRSIRSLIKYIYLPTYLPSAQMRTRGHARSIVDSSAGRSDGSCVGSRIPRFPHDSLYEYLPGGFVFLDENLPIATVRLCQPPDKSVMTYVTSAYFSFGAPHSCSYCIIRE